MTECFFRILIAILIMLCTVVYSFLIKGDDLE